VERHQPRVVGRAGRSLEHPLGLLELPQVEVAEARDDRCASALRVARGEVARPRRVLDRLAMPLAGRERQRQLQMHLAAFLTPLVHEQVLRHRAERCADAHGARLRRAVTLDPCTRPGKLLQRGERTADAPIMEAGIHRVAPLVDHEVGATRQQQIGTSHPGQSPLEKILEDAIDPELADQPPSS
jgi:hypothetical protein